MRRDFSVNGRACGTKKRHKIGFPLARRGGWRHLSALRARQLIQQRRRRQQQQQLSLSLSKGVMFVCVFDTRCVFSNVFLEFSSGSLGRHNVGKRQNLFSDQQTLYKNRLRRKMSQNSRRGGFGRFPSTARTTSPIIGRTRPRTARRRVIRNLVATAKKSPPRRRRRTHHRPEKIPRASSTEYVSKEDLGRATWLLLHSIASQYPDEPTEREKRREKFSQRHGDFISVQGVSGALQDGY